MKVIANYKNTLEILTKYDLKAKKKFGQNFIIDENIIDKIVEVANVSNDTIVFEIGPGLGALTQKLALKAFKVIAYEIDKDMVEVLKNELGELNNLEIINEDFLNINLIDEISKHNYLNKNFLIISNLPYYLTSEILIKLCLLDLDKTSLVVMMQKEVATRILKTNGGSDENTLTLLSKYYFDVKLGLQVSKNIFIPRPNVDSTVLVYKHKDIKELTKEEELIYLDLIKVLFAFRRKTIYNNLKEYLKPKQINDIFKLMNFDENVRVDDLKPTDFIKIAKIVFQSKHQNP